MVIEPPGETRIARILEIDDGVLVAIEKLRLENLRGFVGHTSVGKLCIRIKCTADESAEDSRRGGSVEAMVVIEYSNPHVGVENLLVSRKRGA